ncbi:hypothetical protein M2266_003683 [Streptomyces sp. SPB162]|nr:hypothetical protein [Streptomyces sp. SPB162]
MPFDQRDSGEIGGHGDQLLVELGWVGEHR